MYAGTAPEKVGKVIEKTLQHMSDMADKGPTDQELDQGRQQMRAHTHMMWESVGTRARVVGEHFVHTREVVNPQEELERLCSVTKSELRTNMQELLSQSPTCTVLADKAAMPTHEQLTQWGAAHVRMG